MLREDCMALVFRVFVVHRKLLVYLPNILN